MPKAVAKTYDERETPNAGGPFGRLIDLFRRRPIDTLAGLVASAGVATILVNALLLQEGRHPAPLFHEGAARSAPAALQRSELVAQIQQELASRGYYDGSVDGVFGGKTSSAIIAFELAAHLPSSGEPSDRVLAALMVAPPRKETAAPQAPPAPPQRAPASAPARQPAGGSSPATTGSVAAPKLMAVQRALSRLGYGPVTIDGKMGAATRTALMSFERDRKLPQTGEPGAAVLKELEAMTGAPLE